MQIISIFLIYLSNKNAKKYRKFDFKTINKPFKSYI